jgi:hypothetical protein
MRSFDLQLVTVEVVVVHGAHGSRCSFGAVEFDETTGGKLVPRSQNKVAE